jgi:hypothetical protein
MDGSDAGQNLADWWFNHYAPVLAAARELLASSDPAVTGGGEPNLAEWAREHAVPGLPPDLSTRDPYAATPTGAASAREEELRAAIAWEVAEMYRDGTLEPMPITTTREITDRIMRAVLAAEG